MGVQLLASSVAESREGPAGPLEHFSTSISSSNAWLFLWRTRSENQCKWPISHQSLKQFINKNNNPSSAWAHHERRQPPNSLISQMKGMTFKCMQISTFRINSSQQHLSLVYHLGVIRPSVLNVSIQAQCACLLIIQRDNKSVLWSEPSGHRSVLREKVKMNTINQTLIILTRGSIDRWDKWLAVIKGAILRWQRIITLHAWMYSNVHEVENIHEHP